MKNILFYCVVGSICNLHVSMRKLIEETEKADDDNKKKLVQDSNMTGSKGEMRTEIILILI